MKKPNASPVNLSKKYHCDYRAIYQWLRDNHIYREGYRYGEDYTIDARTEKRLAAWLRERKARPWTLLAVAGRYGCGWVTVYRWLKSHHEHFSKDPRHNQDLEERFAADIARRKEARRSQCSPKNLSRKYHCDLKPIYRWLEENNIKQDGGMYGVDYFIDAATEQRLAEWLLTRKERSASMYRTSANGVAKRSGCSRQLVCVWAKKNGITMDRRQYIFTEKQEKMFNQRRGGARRALK